MNQKNQVSTQIPYNNMMYGYYVPAGYQTSNNKDERIAGGFVFPFLLGGVTGAAIAPAFWNNGYGYNRRPVYYYQPSPYYPYTPRRWF